MGCSSSALSKAGDGSRFRSGGAVPSNENSSAGEPGKFCVAQPRPCTPGREAAFYGSSDAQRAGRAPLEKPKASVVPTANGVNSCRRQPPSARKDAAGEPGEPGEPGEDLGAPRLGGQGDFPGPEDTAEDVGGGGSSPDEAQGLKGTAEAEPPGAAAGRTWGAREHSRPGAGEDAEMLQTAAGTQQLQETAEDARPPGGGTGSDAQPQTVGAATKEGSGSPGALEGDGFAGKVRQKEPRETWKDLQSRPLEATLKESGSPGVARGGQAAACTEEQPPLPEITVLWENQTPPLTPDTSQLALQTPETSESPWGTPEGTRHAGESQHEATAGSWEQPAEATAAETAETAAEATAETAAEATAETAAETAAEATAETAAEATAETAAEATAETAAEATAETAAETAEATADTAAEATAAEATAETAETAAETAEATAETAADVGIAGEIHTHKEEQQHVEGETGEKMDAEMKNERESEVEEAGAKEEETGEAVDSDRRT